MYMPQQEDLVLLFFYLIILFYYYYVRQRCHWCQKKEDNLVRTGEAGLQKQPDYKNRKKEWPDVFRCHPLNNFLAKPPNKKKFTIFRITTYFMGSVGFCTFQNSHYFSNFGGKCRQ